MTLAVRRRGSRFYFAALGIAQVCAIVRYAFLARILGPEQLGMAALIVLSGQFFDSLTDTGNDRFLIQDRAGDSEAAFKLVELVAVLRGFAMAALIVLLAGPVAQLARVPQITDALRIFAVVPFITGFTNYDYRAAQRDHNFRPEGSIIATSEISALVVTIAAALIVVNFTAILYGLATRAAVAVAVSHLLARRGYAIGYDQELARRLWRFGIPLMLNGLLLFAATQSDRVIISRTLGVDELGRYSVVLLPVYYPAALIMRFLSGLYLPQLASAARRSGALLQVSDQLSSTSFLLAALISAGFAAFAPPLLPIIFGSAFVQASVTVSLVGTLTALRLIKVAPTTVAIALGATEIPLLNNMLRMFGIPCAILGLMLTRDLSGVLYGLIAGEIIANITASILVDRRAGWTTLRDGARYAAFAILSCALFAHAFTQDRHDERATVVCSLVCIAAFSFVLFLERTPMKSWVLQLRKH